MGFLRNSEMMPSADWLMMADDAGSRQGWGGQ
jgi:hypothetical protein